MFSKEDVNEVADVAPGHSVVTLQPKSAESESIGDGQLAPPSSLQPTKMSTAKVGPDGKVRFEFAKEPETPAR